MDVSTEAPASFHGHDVLNLLLQEPAPLSLEDIREKVKQHFGPAATFHTCSAEGFSADALLAFFLERGKIQTAGDGYAVAGHRICNH